MDDNIQSLTRANNLKDGTDEIEISKTNILPSISFNVLEENSITNSIIKQNGIDLNELSKYINIVLVIQQKVDYKYKSNLVYPVRICKVSDFENHNYVVDQ